MIATDAPARPQDVRRLLAEFKSSSSDRERAVLTVLVGVPGSGKSWVAEEFRARTGATVLESDAMRRRLFARRSYSADESRRLFAAIHGVVAKLLARKLPVVLDATNLAEAERMPLYELAEKQDAALVVVHVTAPDDVIRDRLARRARDGDSSSEADLRVYERMRTQVEAIQRPHYVVDTSQAAESTLAAIAEEMTAA